MLHLGGAIAGALERLMIGRRLAPLAALLVLAAVPALAEMPGTPAELRQSTVRPLGDFGGWSAVAGETADGVAMCTAFAYSRSGAASLAVSAYLGGVSRQVNVALLDRPGDSRVSLFLEQAGYDLVARSGAYTHWMASPEAEASALKRLAAGTIAYAAVTAADGAVSYERFDLAGFAQASAALAEACPQAAAAADAARYGAWSVTMVTGADTGQLACQAAATLAGVPGLAVVVATAPGRADHLIGFATGRQPATARLAAVLGDRRFATYAFGDMRLVWPGDAGDFLDRLKGGLTLALDNEADGSRLGETPTEGAAEALAAIDRCGLELEAATP
jgi:hypothetical protein